MGKIVIAANIALWGFAIFVWGINWGWWPDPFSPVDCRNAPKEVPYHDGMSLCPGQSAIFYIMPRPDVDEYTPASPFDTLRKIRP